MLKGAADILGERLAAALARVVELERINNMREELLKAAETSRTKLRNRVAELEAALRTFADAEDADDICPDDLRKARAVLAKGRAQG